MTKIQPMFGRAPDEVTFSMTRPGWRSAGCSRGGGDEVWAQAEQFRNPFDGSGTLEEHAPRGRVADLTQLEAEAASTEAQLHLHHGRYDCAIRSAVHAHQLADATGDPLTRADCLQIEALVLWHLGDTTAAIENCQLAVDLLGGERPGPDPSRWAMNLTNLAEGMIEQGDWTDAQKALDRVLAVPDLRGRECDFACRLSRHLHLWRNGPDPDYVAGRAPADPGMSLETMMLQDLLAGRYTDADISSHHRDLVRARAELRTALADERTVQLPEALYNLLGVAARTEADTREQQWPDPDPTVGTWTVGQIELLLDLMTPAGPVTRAQEAHIRADLARWAKNDHATTWAHVVALWRRVPHPRPLAMALIRLGAVAAASGDNQSARQALAEALQISQRLGAQPLSTSAQELAAEHHLRIGPSVGSRGHPTSLTIRETEVLRLVAEGASNGEIAKQLFISPRTVSVHVSHILDKLGVATRTAAATVALKAGLLMTDEPE